MSDIETNKDQKRSKNVRLALLLGGFVILNAVVSLTLWIHKFNLASDALK